MKYLNLGCGAHYSTRQEWTNLDFVSTSEFVIAHNLLNGIPFGDNNFDLVYHSHVLEHFSKEDGEKMIAECFRVLTPGGILRIAIPDLERIVRNYLRFVEEGLANPNDETTRANYEWMLLEMYDQAVRNFSGGMMGKYLFRDIIKNEDFVLERIGREGKDLRTQFFKLKEIDASTNHAGKRKLKPVNIITRLKKRLKNYLLHKLHLHEKTIEIGRFRLGGEIHQWMYDRYSLSYLLKGHGGKKICIRDAFTSYISNWADYEIDGMENVVRKPDSLFIEAIK